MIQSALEHARLLAIEPQKSATETKYNKVLWHVIGQCIPEMLSDIEHLKKLLPRYTSTVKAGSRVKWLLDARRVNEVSKKSDRQHIILSGELQIAAQYVLSSIRVSYRL